jgi:hypothetical protein
MADRSDPQIVRRLPGHPGVDAARNPLHFPPGARSMLGVPVNAPLDAAPWQRVLAGSSGKSGKNAGRKKQGSK